MLASSKPSSFTTASPEYRNTFENMEIDLKSYLMKKIESFKEYTIKLTERNTETRSL
jgi:sugar-specific transcriptional regulator TrmB